MHLLHKIHEQKKNKRYNFKQKKNTQSIKINNHIQYSNSFCK